MATTAGYVIAVSLHPLPVTLLHSGCHYECNGWCFVVGHLLFGRGCYMSTSFLLYSDTYIPVFVMLYLGLKCCC
ncbi:hypothetical protein F5J12DRAFT_851643 [Pisolithus orientalis]|uniref:uncharacterized protein n=1 Tax=Pisolithus orientalis TaxID=936130 RepID=UPI00222582C5|nr:uncharacterized protein F5J12DRAFT_851643 [Pisolithus orientalis]KAI5997231.1 hypothetical protein F5J12DRAFT_851643 [Pisolithus orientalis]